MSDAKRIAELQRQVALLQGEVATLQQALTAPTQVHIDYHDIVKAIREADAKAGFFDLEIARVGAPKETKQ
jgi:hypothetical protein